MKCDDRTVTTGDVLTALMVALFSIDLKMDVDMPQWQRAVWLFIIIIGIVSLLGKVWLNWRKS